MVTIYLESGKLRQKSIKLQLKMAEKQLSGENKKKKIQKKWRQKNKNKRKMATKLEKIITENGNKKNMREK